MLKSNYAIPDLPPALTESMPVLREAARAHRFLAELKGRAGTIPNQGILIDTLSLQEAKASSEIENIVTTQDELFRTGLHPDHPASPAAKEVALYNEALKCGFDNLHRTQRLLTNTSLIAMFRARYLGQLALGGMLIKHQAGRNNYYINAPLVQLLTQDEQEQL